LTLNGQATLEFQVGEPHVEDHVLLGVGKLQPRLGDVDPGR
jgi:hypothetical protein